MMLRRYSLLALMVLSVEVLLLFLFRTPLKDVVRVPRTYQEIMYGNTVFSASVLPSLFSPSASSINTHSAPVGWSLTIPKHISIEQKLIASGLVNIRQIDSTIAVNLKYATEDNFLRKNLYGELKDCYLQKDIAGKLAMAQANLRKRYPFYSLIVYDAVRPASIQRVMWEKVQVSEKWKDKYVSDPQVGSLHNFGCAVDVSIINEQGWEMDMGTPYDYFGELGHPIAEERMIKEGKLSWRQFENRKLLRGVMTEAGFTTITTEWWHFNGSSLKTAGMKYRIVE